MKTIKIFLAIILLVLSYQTVNARIIHVPTGSSIQDSIDVANNGDTVLVDCGTYYENIDFGGKNILVASNYIFDRLDATVDSTIINGGGLNRVVKMQSVNGANAGIIGFTITNGRAVEDNGGGIYCYLTSARISHNVITRDTAGCGVGGGIYVGWKSSPTIDSNQILSNEAANGGGITFSDSSSGEIYGNIIRNNRAWSDNGGGNGGGLHIGAGSSPNIHNNTIDSNTARWSGGGIACYIASPSITYNTISGNSSDEGGGISYGNSSSPFIEHNYIVGNHSGCGGGISAMGSRSIVKRNIIAENSATEGGGGITSWTDTSSIINNTFYNNSGADGARAGGICCWSNAVPEIKQNIIVNSSFGYGIGCSPGSNPVISYNDVWDNYSGNFYGCPPGVGDTSWGENCNQTPCDSFYNIIEGPLFDPASNYALLCTSVCIDAGDSTDSVPCGGGRFIDMGWIEFCYIGDCNGDCVMDLGDVLYLISYLYKGGPAPDPLEAGDVNCDGVVDLGDVLYLINCLYKGGPCPCEECSGKAGGFSANTNRLSSSLGHAEVSLLLKSDPANENLTGFAKASPGGFDEVSEIFVLGKFNQDVVGVHLEIDFNPNEVTLLDPALTPLTNDLQLFAGTKDGTQKIGMVDLVGKEFLPAGEGTLVNLKAQGKNLTSIRIKKAILFGMDAVPLALELSSELKHRESKASESTPRYFSLFQNYPNPFNPETQISYDLPNDSWVRLSIYNIRGQKVRTLVDRFEAAGHKKVKWDGKDDQEDRVASGIYLYRLEAGEFTATRKMVLMR